jgi:hypothetical protein
LNLLVDHNVSPYLARAIAEVVKLEGHRVVPLEEKFHRNTSDFEWILALGDEGGWSFLSDDHRIRKNAAERRALRQARLTGFFFAKGWRKLGTIEKTARVLLHWPRLVRAEQLFHRGAMIEIPVKGTRLTQL